MLKYMYLVDYTRILWYYFTFKKGTDFPPTGNCSLFGVLAESCLQEKQGDAAGEEEEDIRDEEHPLGKR